MCGVGPFGRHKSASVKFRKISSSPLLLHNNRGMRKMWCTIQSVKNQVFSDNIIYTFFSSWISPLFSKINRVWKSEKKEKERHKMKDKCVTSRLLLAHLHKTIVNFQCHCKRHLGWLHSFIYTHFIPRQKKKCLRISCYKTVEMPFLAWKFKIKWDIFGYF